MQNILDNLTSDTVMVIRTIPRSPEYFNLTEQAISVLNELNITDESKVLDIGCGKIASISRGLNILAPGCKITALDTFDDPLDLPANVKWIKCDMFDEKLELELFDAMFWISPYIGNSWFDGSFEKIVQRFGENLKPGGKFMLDLFDFAFIEIGETNVKITYNAKTEYTKSAINIYSGTKTFLNGKVYDLIWRVFSQPELEEIFKSAGFKLTGRLKSFGENLPLNIKEMVGYREILRDIYLFEKV